MTCTVPKVALVRLFGTQSVFGTQNPVYHALPVCTQSQFGTQSPVGMHCLLGTQSLVVMQSLMGMQSPFRAQSLFGHRADLACMWGVYLLSFGGSTLSRTNTTHTQYQQQYPIMATGDGPYEHLPMELRLQFYTQREPVTHTSFQYCGPIFNVAGSSSVAQPNNAITHFISYNPRPLRPPLPPLTTFIRALFNTPGYKIASKDCICG